MAASPDDGRPATFSKATWLQRVIVWMQMEQNFVDSLLIPLLVFLIDLVIRFGFRIDTADVGPDMALLGIGVLLATAFATEREETGLQYIRLALVFLLISVLGWIVCLALLSLRYVYGTVISLLGLALFVGSSVSANELRRIKRRFMGLEL